MKGLPKRHPSSVGLVRFCFPYFLVQLYRYDVFAGKVRYIDMTAYDCFEAECLLSLSLSLLMAAVRKAVLSKVAPSEQCAGEARMKKYSKSIEHHYEQAFR